MQPILQHITLNSMTSILQVPITEWPLVISILALVLTLIGATWIISGAINKKVDKVDFDEHCKENKEDFEKEHQHASTKVSIKLFEQESEQNKAIIASLKHDIELGKKKNDEVLKAISDLKAGVDVINNNIDWIKKNIKCS